MANNPQPGALIFGRTADQENVPVKVLADGSLDVNVAVSGSATAISDGVDDTVKATVVESVANPGTFGLVALASDGADISGGGGGGGAVTIADGADVTQGATTDAAVTGDNSGTVNAHLRGLTKILADVWDSVSHQLKVQVQNATLAITGFVRTGTQAAVADTFTLVDVPASATRATATKASAGVGKRNVCTGFTVTLCANGTAPVPTTPITVAVIDGASGGTTYLWRTQVNLPAAAGGIVSFVRSGLWLVGSQATALTVEFSGAGPTNTYQSVAADGVVITE